MRIAIDAMGGDFAPGAPLDGALQAARDFGLALALVGPRARLEDELGRRETQGLDLEIVEAAEVVAMDEAPTALRRKPGASVKVLVEAVANGRAAAGFTAGHTGAAVLAAHGAFGMLPGAERPALVTTVPTRTGEAVLLDSGANVECRPQHLVHFAVMGSVFARLRLGTPTPRVALLSIGEEASKGNELTRDAHQRLRATALNFIGNIEARDVFAGRADVIVCDGFTGNIALKVGEGLADALRVLLEADLRRTWRSRFGAWLSRDAFRGFCRRIDDAERGGAPLVGVAGVCVIGHGRSSPRAVRNGVGLAAQLVREGVLERFEHELRDEAARAVAGHDA